MAALVFNRTSSIQYCRAEDGRLVELTETTQAQFKPTYEDVNRHLANGIFTLRRPGSYAPIAGLCALPPHTSWLVSSDVYKFAGDLRKPHSKSSTVKDIFDYAQKLLAITKKENKRVAVELSGGLDSSIVIEFLLRQSVPVSLIAFTSNRYEFRTERMIQSHYERRCSSVHLIPYENSPAFSHLDEVPSHPFPVQESLFFSRHMAAAKACKELGVEILLSGEAGDQLMGFEPESCDAFGHAPEGYAYWNLSELWSDQYVYQPLGCNYVSGLAVGKLPALILQARSGLGPDHMKMWARNNLENFLPKMLTKFAYKAFHDGWVIDGLITAAPTIYRISKNAYQITHHPELQPSLIQASAMQYRFLSEEQRAKFFAKLAFITWVFSNSSEK